MSLSGKVFPINNKSWLTLRKECPYSELFWSAFSCIQTEYQQMLRICPYSVRMRQNVDQNNYEYGHFSRSLMLPFLINTPR